MNTVYLHGNVVRLDSAKIRGAGGEARIYEIAPHVVAKVFRPENDTFFDGLPNSSAARLGAKLRILEHQTKLKEIPKTLPRRVITPIALLFDCSGRTILGYTMRYLNGAILLAKYSDPDFAKGGIFNQQVIEIFTDMHETLCGIHKAGVVVGDFNYCNVLVIGKEAWFIDVDSMQFGRYLCKMYTLDFVDPCLCAKNGAGFALIQPYSSKSDWYAYSAMLFSCLLSCIGPYDGVYKPRIRARWIPHQLRLLERITVFHPEVRYPKPAIPYDRLPDDLLHYFYLVFEKDRREIFPLAMLVNLRWIKCSACGSFHARNVCPVCATVAPVAVREIVVVRGKVTATRFFRTKGIILNAVCQDGVLFWLYHEDQSFKREDGSRVTRGELRPHLKFRLRKKSTFVGSGNELMTFTLGQAVEKLLVSSMVLGPVFDTNGTHLYWVEEGKLKKDGAYGPELIGGVLASQTMFWAGPSFGFGFYRAGDAIVAFVFDAEVRGINDSVKIPRFQGQLLDAECVFSEDLAWFFTTTMESGVRINRCTVLSRSGTVLATAEAKSSDESWLAPSIHGMCAFKSILFVPTDEGIVRVELTNGRIQETKKFPDTEPFVSAASKLLPGKQGLYVVDRQQITLLKIV